MPISALSWRCAKHIGKKRGITPLTELGVFHAQLWWLPRAAGLFWVLGAFSSASSQRKWGLGTCAEYMWVCLSVSLDLSSGNSESIVCPQPYLTDLMFNEMCGQVERQTPLSVPHGVSSHRTNQSLSSPRESRWQCRDDNLSMYHKLQNLGHDPALSQVHQSPRV